MDNTLKKIEEAYDTVSEENEFFGLPYTDKTDQLIKSFYRSQISSLLEELEKGVEGMEKNEYAPKDAEKELYQFTQLPNNYANMIAFVAKIREISSKVDYNQALSEVKALINKLIK